MLANYGYQDGSGDYFITIDTDKCTGCGDCVTTCPAQVFEILTEDPHDPFREEPVAVVKSSEKKKIKYSCGPCKPVGERPPSPCVVSCRAGAISHNW
ncbi:MAG: 4Fe-4S dicluster domain-containing protein [Deltaproteobacteria bacterium]|nr:4Fe-4S dicluster domain-containing protein [Deltaproteobacteria bacterium]